MGSPEIEEYIDTFVTEVIDFINVENFEVLTGLSQSDEAFRVEVATVEEVEVCEFCKVCQKFCKGEIRTTVTPVAALHLVSVSVTVETTCREDRGENLPGQEMVTLTCGLQVESPNLTTARGEEGEVCEGERLAELDLQVKEKVTGAGEDGDQLGEIISGPDTQSAQLTASPESNALINLQNVLISSFQFESLEELP